MSAPYVSRSARRPSSQQRHVVIGGGSSLSNGRKWLLDSQYLVVAKRLHRRLNTKLNFGTHIECQS